EADRVVDDYKAIVAAAERISTTLPENARDAFFQFVIHAAKANSLVTELYVAAARNHLYAAQGRAGANNMAARTRALFQSDIALTDYYNHTLAKGKWNHMMDQTHIGYTYWQEPPRNSIPAVKEIELPAAAAMGLAIEGSAGPWPTAKVAPVLPGFDVYNQPKRSVDVFNRGKEPFEFTASASAPWIVLSAGKGKVV